MILDKSNITPSLIVALEMGARYTLTDNLDGSNPKKESLKSSQFGNINNNDWYVLLTLTYTFGENHVTVQTKTMNLLENIDTKICLNI
jgi:protein involved in ribonucleotide reduction